MYGIIGYPLLQTFSPDYFNRKFEQLGLNATYQKFPLNSIGALKELLLKQPELKGLNVTIPYKEAVLPFLDELDDTARTIGAVNTIKIQEGSLKGFNTDTVGFTDSLKPLLQEQHSRALLLGTGGASRAVAYSLRQLGIPFLSVSRTATKGQRTYAGLDAGTIAGHKLIVNTTPLGMMPDTDTCPDIPYQYLTTEHLLYDLVYNPAETLFLQKGKRQGAAIKNGHEMLIGQAEAAWNIWDNS